MVNFFPVSVLTFTAILQRDARTLNCKSTSFFPTLSAFVFIYLSMYMHSRIHPEPQL